MCRKGRRCRPIGAWTRSQPVGCQGDISTFLLCAKGARPLGADEGPTPPAVAHRDPTNPTMPALRLQKATARPGPLSGPSLYDHLYADSRFHAHSRTDRFARLWAELLRHPAHP